MQHTHTQTYIHTYMHACMHAYIYIYIHIYILYIILQYTPYRCSQVVNCLHKHADHMVILTERGFQDPYVLVTPLVPLVSEFVIRDKMLAFSFGRTQAVPFKMITVDHLYASCRPKVALKSSLHFFFGGKESDLEELLDGMGKSHHVTLAGLKCCGILRH